MMVQAWMDVKYLLQAYAVNNSLIIISQKFSGIKYLQAIMTQMYSASDQHVMISVVGFGLLTWLPYK